MELSQEEVNGYISSLSTWISSTIKDQDPKSIDAIRNLWDGESWENIQKKLLSEGSEWHVWWMDGVRKYIAIDQQVAERQSKPLGIVNHIMAALKANDSKLLIDILDEYKGSYAALYLLEAMREAKVTIAAARKLL